MTRAPEISLPTMVTNEGHLGGYRTDGDPSSWTPQLWDWLIDEFQVRSVIDIGCGLGCELRYFAGKHCEIFGIDGSPSAIQNSLTPSCVLEHDYSKGPFIPNRWFSLAWSCEFLEHVEERFMPNYMLTFQKAGLAVVTHALPGQPGHHHVNCRPPKYWVDAFSQYGFSYDPVATSRARQVAPPASFFARSGLVFRNRLLRGG